MFGGSAARPSPGSRQKALLVLCSLPAEDRARLADVMSRTVELCDDEDLSSAISLLLPHFSASQPACQACLANLLGAPGLELSGKEVDLALSQAVAMILALLREPSGQARVAGIASLSGLCRLTGKVTMKPRQQLLWPAALEVVYYAEDRGPLLDLVRVAACMASRADWESLTNAILSRAERSDSLDLVEGAFEALRCCVEALGVYASPFTSRIVKRIEIMAGTPSRPAAELMVVLAHTCPDRAQAGNLDPEPWIKILTEKK